MAFNLRSGNTSAFKAMGSSPAKQKYDLSKATVDGKHPQTEKNKKYKDVDSKDLFMQGKTRDKDGNVKDIQWAPGPTKRPKVKKSPTKQTTDRETMRQRARDKNENKPNTNPSSKNYLDPYSKKGKAHYKKEESKGSLPKMPNEGNVAHTLRKAATWLGVANKKMEPKEVDTFLGVRR